MPSTESLLDPQDTFATLCTTVGLDIRLRKGLSRLGFVRPTLVQSKCLPLAVTSGRDLLVRARTGSGKTLAYCLPILHKILSNGGENRVDEIGFVKAVILVPTRELCTQVTKTLNSLIYYCDDIISVAALFSSNNSSEAGLAQQQAMLRDRPDIIVSTPAGLLAHIKRQGNSLKTSLKHSVESLVVDEADLVLSFGYADDVTEIMKYLPSICQGFLMSATLTPELNALKRVVLHSPAVLKLEEDDGEKSAGKTEGGNLSQFYLNLPKRDKTLVIYVFLKLGLLKGKGIFFVNTIDSGYRLKLFLEQFHIRSAVLNAELPLRSRLNVIEQFNVGNFDYLIATDESTDMPVTAKGKDISNEFSEDERRRKKNKSKKNKDGEYGVSRGLDFRGVSFVVNVDFPMSPDSYIHRIGRTARGGAKGVALSLVEEQSKSQNELLARVQDTQAPLGSVASSASDNLHATTSINDDGLGEHLSGGVASQPSPLDFDLTEIEGFRYRVEDVSRAVTKIAVRETRAAELKAEILNSQRLQNHFAENPSELQLLRHDRQATHVSKVQDHLKNVPKYLLPRGMQVAETRKRKRRKRNGSRNGSRRTDNDPLQSCEGENINLDGVTDEGASNPNNDDDFDDPLESGADENGKSTSGRQAWQQKHGRGKFSKGFKRKEKDGL